MVDANQLTGDNWQLAVVRGEKRKAKGERLWDIGDWQLAIGD